MQQPTYISGLVTIAIPAYKKTFLADAIRSALSQTYANIELVIVDDDSPNDLQAIVATFKDSRIRYYRNFRNLGAQNVVKNWNKCLEYARGEFFVLLCDDDLLEANFVQELMKLANKYPTCNVFHARKRILYEDTKEIVEDEPWTEWEGLETFYANKVKLKRFHTITEFMYRTAHIAPLGYVEFPVAWGSDDISIFQFIKDGGIASSQVCLAAFRYNDEHISKSGTHMIEKAQARIKNFYWAGEFFKGNRYDAEMMGYLGRMMKEFVRRADVLDKFRIWAMVPKQAWSMQERLKVLIGIFIGRYRHPGYGAIGV